MMCLSLSLIENLLLWVVAICVVVGIIRILLPLVVTQLGSPVIQIINLLLWAVVVVAVIVICFDILSCLMIGGLRHV